MGAPRAARQALAPARLAPQAAAPAEPAGPEEPAGPAGPTRHPTLASPPPPSPSAPSSPRTACSGDAFAPAARGLRAWAAAINAKGGIGGRKIVLKTCDDREDRSRSLECARRLVEQDKVFALVGTNSARDGRRRSVPERQGRAHPGDPDHQQLRPLPPLLEHATPTGYPRDGQTVGYKGKLMSLSGGYRWFKQNLNVTKAAVFSYDIDESKQAGGFIAAGLKLEGFDVAEYAVSFAAPSFDQAVADMQARGTQIVFDAMDDGANRKLCDSMQRRQFTADGQGLHHRVHGRLGGQRLQRHLPERSVHHGFVDPVHRHQRSGRR